MDEERIKGLCETLDLVWEEFHAGQEETEDGDGDDAGLHGLL